MAIDEGFGVDTIYLDYRKAFDSVSHSINQSINQSINAEFVARRYATLPGAPAESVKSTIKKYILESFSKCTGISRIMKVGWKSVPGGWTGVEEATFTKSCSCSWQNVGLSAAGCRNCGNTVLKAH